MADDLRSDTPGETFFFTARLADPRSRLLTDQVALLRKAMRDTVKRSPFTIDAIVILPAAIHTLWTLPAGDADCRSRWRLLKSRFSRALPALDHRTTLQMDARRNGIWQHGVWEHRIRSAQDFALHRSLIHTAPVQAGLVDRPADWRWTSLHRDLADAHATDHSTPPPRFSRTGLRTVPRRDT